MYKGTFEYLLDSVLGLINLMKMMLNDCILSVIFKSLEV
jgi:hypothetical protein